MALESVSEVSFEAASDNPRELRTVAELRELTVTCDLSGLQWTPRVVVQNQVTPRSHPVLTLNTRVTGDPLLATYLHEQLHWWTADHPGFGLAIGDTRSEWATVADIAEGGARDERSTRLHLIVCHLERRAMECVVGRSRTAAVLRNQIRDRIYPWVYGQIEIHDRWLDTVCSERDLWPARIAFGLKSITSELVRVRVRDRMCDTASPARGGTFGDLPDRLSPSPAEAPAEIDQIQSNPS